MREAFEAWLREQGYRDSTIDKTVGEVFAAHATLTTNGGTLRVGANRCSLQRLQKFLRDEPSWCAASNFANAVVDTNLAPVKRAGAGVRKKPTRSFHDDNWKQLVTAFNAGTTPEDFALSIMVGTSHRIGDVLRIERKDLGAALRSGLLQLERKGGGFVDVRIDGMRDVWERLYKHWPEQHAMFAHWVCPNSTHDAKPTGGAYQACRRHILRVANDLGIDGRIHTHRIRRTVLVRALKHTGDMNLVQQLGGHASITSTQEYVDEQRADEVAKLQQALRKNT